MRLYEHGLKVVLRKIDNFLPTEGPDFLLSGRDGLTRREIAERVGQTVGFGLLLAELQRSGLPLPRIPSERNSPGVQMIKNLTERAMARAE